MLCPLVFIVVNVFISFVCWFIVYIVGVESSSVLLSVLNNHLLF